MTDALRKNGVANGGTVSPPAFIPRAAWREVIFEPFRFIYNSMISRILGLILDKAAV
jgi:hypothetical protein